jgi:hypothetical protein
MQAAELPIRRPVLVLEGSMARRRTLPGMGLAGLALPAPALAAEGGMVTDPTGSPLNVRWFDGKVIGVLHYGEIVRILRMGADKSGKPGAYVAYETNGSIGSSSAAT